MLDHLHRCFFSEPFLVGLFKNPEVAYILKLGDITDLWHIKWCRILVFFECAHSHLPSRLLLTTELFF